MFYVYELRDPRDESCFYVGKGNTTRSRLADHIRNARKLINGEKPADHNPIKAGIIRRLLEDGCDPILVKVFESIDEREVLCREIELISMYGRKADGTGCLANLTAGGEGTFGLKVSEEGRVNIAAASRGRIHSEETRERMRQAALGRTHSDETKKKISDVQKGKVGTPHTDATKEKIRNAALGRKHDSATLNKISAARKGKPWSEARRIAQETRKN